MCELLGASLKEKEDVSGYLSEFFGHGIQHPHGWGIFREQNSKYEIIREALNSAQSELAKETVINTEPQNHFLAHIRLATAGAVKLKNCHPFSRKDESGRCWTLIHNGTIYMVHTLTGNFAKQFGFAVTGEDEDGNVFSLQNSKNGDILSFDCSYNNLELSFGKEKSLHNVWERFRIYYNYIQSQLKNHNCTFLLDNDTVIYHHGYNATELRKLLIQNNIPKFINEDELYSLAKNITDLAADGLKNRGFGEDEFLVPVYERISNRTNPAKYMLERLNNGADIEEIVVEYAKISGGKA